MIMKIIRNQRGVALITSLLMSLVIMVMVTGVLYFITQSTKMSGAGKSYATADDAALGSIDLIKDSINLVIWGSTASDLIIDSNACFSGEVLTQVSGACSVTVDLPSTDFSNYTATITLERLFSRPLPGGRLEFSRSAGGAPSTSIFYKISTQVTGPGNSRAENSALYRWAG